MRDASIDLKVKVEDEGGRETVTLKFPDSPVPLPTVAPGRPPGAIS